MSLREKIETEYKIAVKSKDKNKISTYRLILSGIKDLDIANRSGPNKKDTDDSDISKLLNRRDDLLKIEQNEVDILSAYLPKQFSEEETKKLCSSLVSKLEVKSMKDMGKIMGELKKNHSDSIDFSIAGKIIKEILNNQ